MEKDPYNISPEEKLSNESPNDYHGDVEKITEEKGARIGEAADMYGDLESAEDYGYVSRG